jgi:protein-S-isoprenylcysteine O-methyltransferase Ste14
MSTEPARASSPEPQPAASLQRTPATDMPLAANLGIVRPPIVYAAAILLGIALDALWPLPLLQSAAGSLLGPLFVAAAIVLFVSAVRTFGVAGTPVPGNRPATTVVNRGPYRFTRNPIYLAFTLLHLGLVLWIDTVWLVVTLAAAFALMAFVVVPREERYLEAKFGDVYLAYKRSVRRWM